MLEEEGAFSPYVEAEPNRPATPRTACSNDPRWSAFHLLEAGRADARQCRALPARRMAALERAPMPRIRGRSPMALFSLLRAGAHIAAA